MGYYGNDGEFSRGLLQCPAGKKFQRGSFRGWEYMVVCGFLADGYGGTCLWDI